MTDAARGPEPRRLPHRLVAAVRALAGWRRSVLALAAGAACVLAFAPFHFWPLLFLTFPALVWLLDGSQARPAPARRRILDAAFLGWQFGFGFFLAGLYWVGNSFLVEADRFAWLLPFAVTLLPAGLALFFALATALAAAFWVPGVARILLLAFTLGAAEWLRGHLFTGLPWNTLGYALTGDTAMMQWVSLFGIYGLGFIAIAIFCAPALLWEGAAEGPAGGNRRRAAARLAYVVTALGVLAAGWAWGAARLESARDAVHPDIRLRLVQPKIAQKDKWVPENAASIFRRYLALSRGGGASGQPGLAGITHLIWPESAMPFLLTESTAALEAIAEMLPDDAYLLTGQARAQAALRSDGALVRQKIYNSLLVLDGKARVLAHYDKQHLVPFGEYLPFQEALEAAGLEQLTRVRGGFTPGERRPFVTPEGTPPFAPLICYEIIFPEAVAARARQPRWMLNVTNDAWFGATIGPYQHFHQARVRAVEQGLPLVRAANTGISAVVDAYGRIVASLPLGRGGVIDAELPKMTFRTPYARWGWRIEAAVAFLIAAAALIWRRRTNSN